MVSLVCRLCDKETELTANLTGEDMKVITLCISYLQFKNRCN